MRESDNSTMAAQQVKITHIENEAPTLKQHVSDSNAKLSFLKTPPSASTQRRRDNDDEAMNVSNKSPMLESAADALTESSTNPVQERVTEGRGVTPKRVASVQSRLVFGAEAQAVSQKGNEKGVFIAMVLEGFYRRGLLRNGNWKLVEPPKGSYKRRSHYRIHLNFVRLS